jgi:hypothetical protein
MRPLESKPVPGRIQQGVARDDKRLARPIAFKYGVDGEKSWECD